MRNVLNRVFADAATVLAAAAMMALVGCGGTGSNGVRTGVHEPEEGQEGFVIPSDTRVYLAPGAVVKGTLICDNVENVRIGRQKLLSLDGIRTNPYIDGITFE